MPKNQCPACQSSTTKRYVSDMHGEVIGLDLYCTSCPWSAVGGW